MPVEVKYLRLAVLLILLSPSIFYLGDYFSTAVQPSLSSKQNSVTESDQGWNAIVAVKYPSYVILGQDIPVNVTVRVVALNPNVTISLSNLRAELRVPVEVNSTNNLVSGWTTLSSRLVLVNHSYTSSGRESRTIQVSAIYPPPASVLDSIAPSGRIAINAIANVTIYTNQGNATGASVRMFSVLDDQPVYQSQLSLIRSVSAWMIYQLAAAVIVLAVYTRLALAKALPPDASYDAELGLFVIKRKTLRLEELMNSGRISEVAFNELKQKYAKEQAQLTGQDSSA